MCKQEQLNHLFDYYLTPRGTVEITGVRDYSERLHIPGSIEGHPVTTVRLPNDPNTRYWRQIITTAPVRLQMDFNIPCLKQLDLCRGTVLVQAPNGIEASAWFRDQADGPVYLGDWYCGWKGKPEEENLVLQPGTVGVIRDADRERPWKKVVFPAAISYIGSGAFLNAEEAVTNEHASLKFPLGRPTVCQPVESVYFHREQPLEKLNGWQLYMLANAPEIRSRIPWGWMASAPKLTYDESGWRAEVCYASEDGQEVGYTALFSIPFDEKKLQLEKKTKREYPVAFQGVWSEAYTPQYWMAKEYLDLAAALIRSRQKPTAEMLTKLEEWWSHLAGKKGS